MGSMAQTGLLLVPSDALGHTWALPGVLGAGRGLPPETGPRALKNSLFPTTLGGLSVWATLATAAAIIDALKAEGEARRRY